MSARRTLIVASAGLVTMLSARAAHTATTTGSIQVSVTIPKACSFSTSNLAFGIYNSAQLDATGTVTVTCTSTTVFHVGVDGGLHDTTGFYGWQLIGPTGALLSYKMYRDSARTSYWGGTVGYDALDGTGTGTAQPFTAYGRIPGGQYTNPGAYTDTITFTLYF